MKRSIDANVILEGVGSQSSLSSKEKTTNYKPKTLGNPPVIVTCTSPLLKQLKQPLPIVAKLETENKIISSPTSTGNIQRTTPRKVKKKSGERSLTTGIFFDQNDTIPTQNNSKILTGN